MDPAFKARMEAGVAGAPCPAPPVGAVGYGRAGANAEAIRSTVGDDNFRRLLPRGGQPRRAVTGATPPHTPRADELLEPMLELALTRWRSLPPITITMLETALGPPASAEEAHLGWYPARLTTHPLPRPSGGLRCYSREGEEVLIETLLEPDVSVLADLGPRPEQGARDPCRRRLRPRVGLCRPRTCPERGRTVCRANRSPSRSVPRRTPAQDCGRLWPGVPYGLRGPHLLLAKRCFVAPGPTGMSAIAARM